MASSSSPLSSKLKVLTSVLPISRALAYSGLSENPVHDWMNDRPRKLK